MPGHQGESDSRVKTDAIIWDYDGTLVDTREKNLRITRRILESVAQCNPDDFPALRSLGSYTAANARYLNWRDLYKREFGLGDDLIDRAGEAWTTFQLEDSAPMREFDGIRGLLEELKDVPHGIVSQNSGTAIARVLESNNLSRYFTVIIGYEEVEIRRQKPAPDGLLKAIQMLLPDGHGHVVYIGDHETDVLCARNAAASLASAKSGVRITSIGAAYVSDGDTSHWKSRPDHAAATVDELRTLVKTLV